MKYTNIDTLDFSACDILKKERLFYDPFNKKYYKVWKEGTKTWDRDLGNLFLLALSCGFFEEIANIESLIVSGNGSCIGYVTERMRTAPPLACKSNKHGLSSLCPCNQQGEKYRKLYTRLIGNTVATDFFFYDLVQPNIAEFENRLVLIDLESVLHIRDLYRVPQYHRECISEDYYAFLRTHYDKTVDFTNSGINMDFVRIAWGMATGGMHQKPYYSVTINGEDFDGERPWNLRWPKIKGAMDWSGKKILDLGTCMGMIPAYLLKYSGAASATAVDFNQYLLDASDLVRRAFQVPKDRIRFLNLDMNTHAYEESLGYDHDVVFCLSFLRWIQDQERLLRYLSRFKNVFLEPHDLDGDIVTRFQNHGFTNHALLGVSRIGRSFPENDKRPIYHFWKI